MKHGARVIAPRDILGKTKIGNTRGSPEMFNRIVQPLRVIQLCTTVPACPRVFLQKGLQQIRLENVTAVVKTVAILPTFHLAFFWDFTVDIIAPIRLQHVKDVIFFILAMSLGVA